LKNKLPAFWKIFIIKNILH